MNYAKARFKTELESAIQEKDFENLTAALELIYSQNRYAAKGDARFMLRQDELTLHKLFIGIYRKNPSIKQWKCIRDTVSRLPELAQHLENVHRGFPINAAHIKAA